MINNFKFKGDIKKYVKEYTRKMYYDIKMVTNKIRLISKKIHRLEQICDECKNKIKEMK